MILDALAYPNQRSGWQMILAGTVVSLLITHLLRKMRPMAVLARKAFGTLGAALPHIVLPAIIRSMPGYVWAVLALVIVFSLCTAAQIITEGIPFLGWLLSAAVGFYRLICQARLIGLIYHHYQDNLGWGV